MPNRRVRTAVVSQFLSRALAASLLCILARAAFAVTGDVCAGDTSGATAVCGAPNVSPYRYFTPEWVSITRPGVFNSAAEAIARQRRCHDWPPRICMLSGVQGEFTSPFYVMAVEASNSGLVTWTATLGASGGDSSCSMTNVFFGNLRRERTSGACRRTSLTR
jgi:hypothetical protein